MKPCLFALPALLAGCGGSVLETAAQVDAAHHVEYARKICPMPLSAECIVSYVMPLSGLQCFADESSGRSHKGAVSRACLCARPVASDSMHDACGDWLKYGN